MFCLSGALLECQDRSGLSIKNVQFFYLFPFLLGRINYVEANFRKAARVKNKLVHCRVS